MELRRASKEESHLVSEGSVLCNEASDFASAPTLMKNNTWNSRHGRRSAQHFSQHRSFGFGSEKLAPWLDRRALTSTPSGARQPQPFLPVSYVEEIEGHHVFPGLRTALADHGMVGVYGNACRNTIDGPRTGGFDPAVVFDLHGVAAGRFPCVDGKCIPSSFGFVSMAVHDVNLSSFGPRPWPNVLSISVAPLPAGDRFTSSRLSSVATRS